MRVMKVGLDDTERIADFEDLRGRLDLKCGDDGVDVLG